MWKLEDSSLDPDQLIVNESLFSLANGYLGIRGNFEEGYKETYKSIRGAYINGFYERVDVKYGEKLFGFPESQEKLPNLMDAQSIEIILDGERVSLFNGNHQNYKRVIHFNSGYSERSYDYTTSVGKLANIKFRRMVSMTSKELFLMSIQISYDGDIKLISTLKGDVQNFTDDFDPRVSTEHAKLINVEKSLVKDNVLIMSASTETSGLKAVCSVVHQCNKDRVSVSNDSGDGNILVQSFTSSGSIDLTKYVVYTDSEHHSNAFDEGYQILKDVSMKTATQLFNEQEAYLKAFWDQSDIAIYGNPLIQQGVRFNMFQLLQSVGKDGLTNISAKGLSGEGYEGHYFWDTEIYVLPVFQMMQPQIANLLLMYRHSILDAARERARELGHKRGAKFPWRTIAGKECSTFFPAGTAQYHINADIAYSFVQNYLYHENLEFIRDYGAEVLFETGRLWLEIGHYYKDQFMIHDVTGPDEYTCVVDNNYYTNLLAQYNLKWAAKFYDLLKKTYPEELSTLCLKIGMELEEKEAMEKAAQKMYLPYDEELGINKQDDSFLQKKVWDFDNTPKEKYPLLLHYHPLTIYRYQVIKQADTVLAHFLLEDEVEDDVIKRSFDYYEQITTHDSSLSSCIYGIMASKCGYNDKAYKYFEESVRLDLDNTHGNTKDGLHIANLAGTVMSVIFGFGGYRIKDHGISLNPWCPKEWDGYAFNINYKKRQINVAIKGDVVLTLTSGPPLEIKMYDTNYVLENTLSIPLKEA